MEAEMGPVEIEIAIDKLFEEGVRAAGERQFREEGFHVSGLSYDCMRQIQYGMDKQQAAAENPEYSDTPEEEDFEGILRMWIGTKLHETPLTPKHEWGLYHTFDLNGQKIKVHGHIDEIFECPDGTEIIIDKKFVGNVPFSANDHYKRQVGYYAAIYSRQTGAVVKWGALKYVVPAINMAEYGPKRTKTYVFPVDTEASWKEINERVRLIAEARQKKELLPRTPGWMCLGTNKQGKIYCKFLKECEAASGPVRGG